MEAQISPKVSYVPKTIRRHIPDNDKARSDNGHNLKYRSLSLHWMRETEVSLSYRLHALPVRVRTNQ